jgi:hypothetical protein
MGLNRVGLFSGSSTSATLLLAPATQILETHGIGLVPLACALDTTRFMFRFASPIRSTDREARRRTVTYALEIDVLFVCGIVTQKLRAMSYILFHKNRFQEHYFCDGVGDDGLWAAAWLEHP